MIEHRVRQVSSSQRASGDKACSDQTSSGRASRHQAPSGRDRPVSKLPVTRHPVSGYPVDERLVSECPVSRQPVYARSAKETGERPLAACGEDGGCWQGEGLHGDKSIINQSISKINQRRNQPIRSEGGFLSDYTARTAPLGDSLVAVGGGVAGGRLEWLWIFFL